MRNVGLREDGGRVGVGGILGVSLVSTRSHLFREVSVDKIWEVRVADVTSEVIEVLGVFRGWSNAVRFQLTNL